MSRQRAERRPPPRHGTDLLGSVLAANLVYITQHKVRPLAREEAGGGPADARRGTGDHHDSACQFQGRLRRVWARQGQEMRDSRRIPISRSPTISMTTASKMSADDIAATVGSSARSTKWKSRIGSVRFFASERNIDTV